jgi:rhamnosyltransferase
MISVIIPTLNGAGRIPALVDSLRNQTVKDFELIVVDSESDDGTGRVAASLGCAVHTIARREFDHGGARNLAAEKASGNILVFLTQDALPASPEFLMRLTAPIDGQITAAAYARQVPAPGAKPTEAFSRLYNYPPESSVRHISCVERRTLKTFFFSNAASAVSRSCFESVGRFPAPVSTNEDMLLCARLLDAGYQVAYIAEAVVIHSHQFTMLDLFRRYFRMGVVIGQYHAQLHCEQNAEGGLDFVRKQIAHLRSLGRYDLIPGAAAEAGIKAMAFYCGYARSKTGLLGNPADSGDRQLNSTVVR